MRATPESYNYFLGSMHRTSERRFRPQKSNVLGDPPLDLFLKYAPLVKDWNRYLSWSSHTR